LTLANQLLAEQVASGAFLFGSSTSLPDELIRSASTKHKGIRRINPVGFTFIIQILKQVLPGEFCTTADNIGQLCINNFDLSMLATFASKIEQDMGSLNFDMFVLNRRRTVRSVGFCIGLIANTQVPLVQQ